MTDAGVGLVRLRRPDAPDDGVRADRRRALGAGAARADVHDRPGRSRCSASTRRARRRRRQVLDRARRRAQRRAGRPAGHAHLLLPRAAAAPRDPRRRAAQPPVAAASDGELRHNPDHHGPARRARRAAGARRRPLLGPPDVRLPFSAWQLHEVRTAVEQALDDGRLRARAGRGRRARRQRGRHQRGRARHPGGASCRCGPDAAGWSCEIARRAAPSRDPLPGLQAPHPAEPRGRGVWIARQLCDSLHVWTDGQRHPRSDACHPMSRIGGDSHRHPDGRTAAGSVTNMPLGKRSLGRTLLRGLGRRRAARRVTARSNTSGHSTLGTIMSDDQRRSRTTQAAPGRPTGSRCSAPSPSLADGAAVPLGVDARRLVAYLAVHPRPQERAALAADLWPGVAADAAQRLLTDAVAAVDVPGLLRRRRPDRAAGAGRRRRGRPRRRACGLVRALPEIPAADNPDVALLAADILPGWTAAWIAVERERFRQLRLHALEERSLRLSAAGRHDEAVALAEVGRARRAEPRERPPRPDRGASRAGQHRRGRRRVRRLPGAAALQRGRARPVRSRRRCFPPSPVWPVLRARHPMPRSAVQLPGLRSVRGAAGGTRRLVAGGSAPGTSRPY